MSVVKRNISFQDLDGNPVEEEWYFELSEADAAEMDLAHHENVEAYLTDILERKDSKSWMAVLKEIMIAAVGKREGKLLVKDDAIRREFKFGGAYKQFFSELIEMEDAGNQFFVSVMPQNIQAKVAEELNKKYSKEELLAMTDEEFAKVAGTDVAEMSKEHMQIAFVRKTSKAA